MVVFNQSRPHFCQNNSQFHILPTKTTGTLTPLVLLLRMAVLQASLDLQSGKIAVLLINQFVDSLLIAPLCLLLHRYELLSLVP